MSFLSGGYLSFSKNNNPDEKTIKIPRTYEWQTPKHSWIHQRIWIPEQLQFIVRKTAKVKYDRKEVNRKFNKVLLHELSIDASFETEIELVDETESHDLIGRVSFDTICYISYNIPCIHIHVVLLYQRIPHLTPSRCR